MAAMFYGKSFHGKSMRLGDTDVLLAAADKSRSFVSASPMRGGGGKKAESPSTTCIFPSYAFKTWPFALRTASGSRGSPCHAAWKNGQRCLVVTSDCYEWKKPEWAKGGFRGFNFGPCPLGFIKNSPAG
jgi:hypothetical protein